MEYSIGSITQLTAAVPKSTIEFLNTELPYIKPSNDLQGHRIGLTGTYEAGKKLLIESLSKKMTVDTKIIRIEDAPVWYDGKIAPCDSFTFAERFQIQQELFEFIQRKMVPVTENFIVNHTYIELLAYLFAGTRRDCKNIYKKSVERFIEDVVSMTKKTFDTIIVVQTSTTGDAFQESVNLLVIGTALKYFESSMIRIIPRNLTASELRQRWVLNNL